ncbi:MAG: hypothetical protein COA91_03280 [Robiginitomaculum sp.]|nr:MAG: hypothetical protein COA91_03280 [Robiginitomaculum sp.]
MEPKTKLDVSKAQAAQIRAAVQNVRQINDENGCSKLVQPHHAPEILELLKDERVSGDVYTLPRPFSLQSVTDWILDHQAQARAGDGLLLYARDEHGKIMSVTDFQFWPKWSACEFGGVIAHTHQNQSLGTTGVKAMCDFAFKTIGVRLIALTSSTENIRSQKIIEHLGFTQMGEMDSVRPDGSVRRSLYWEMERGGIRKSSTQL